MRPGAAVSVGAKKRIRSGLSYPELRVLYDTEKKCISCLVKIVVRSCAGTETMVSTRRGMFDPMSMVFRQSVRRSDR